MKLLSLFSIFMMAAICSAAQVHLALEGPEWKETISYVVKGRQGVLIKQNLHFGDYFTTSVDRSWIKARSSFQSTDKIAENSFRNMISSEYIERNQTIFFTFSDSARNKADIHCVTSFRINEINVGNTGVSLSRLFGATAADVYYVQIYTSANEPPWHLAIDNGAAQDQPKTYVTKLVKNNEEFYTVSPYRMVKNNKGKITEMTFGSAGFQIKNRRGEPVAAVSLINKGVVYLKPLDAKERFLLAAACAAMLLQEQIGTE